MLRWKRVNDIVIVLLLITITAYAEKVHIEKESAGGGGTSGYVNFTTNETANISWTYNFTTAGILSANGGNSTYWNAKGTSNLTMAQVVALENLTNYYNITQTLALQNFTNYYNKTETVALTVLTNFYNKTDIQGFGFANTTNLTDHTGNTTIHVTSVNKTAWDGVAANNHTAATVTDTPTIDLTITGQAISGAVVPANLTGLNASNLSTGTVPNARINSSDFSLKNLTKSFVVYNITNTSDFFIPPISSQATTITSIAGYCDGGTDVTGIILRCNTTAASCTVVDNTTWIFTNGSVVTDTSFTNTSIMAGGWLKWNTNITNGTPTFFSLGMEFDED